MAYLSLEFLFGLGWVSGSQCVFHIFDHHIKSSRIGNSNLSQRFSIQVDLCQLQSVDELAVVQSAHLTCSADASDPQFAKLAFFDATITKRVCT